MLFRIIITVLIGLPQLHGCVMTVTESDLPSAEVVEITQSARAASLDGIWAGRFEFDSGKGPFDFTAVHLNDKAFAFSRSAKAVCIGTVALDGNDYTSEYILFALDGGPFDTAMLTGQLVENNRISSRFATRHGGSTGELHLAYDPLYDVPSSLTAIQGNWSYTDEDGLTTEFDIQPDGALTGRDSVDCEYSGRVEIINPAHNAYRIQTQITACGSVNGIYEGVLFTSSPQHLNVHLVSQHYGFYFLFSPN